MQRRTYLSALTGSISVGIAGCSEVEGFLNSASNEFVDEISWSSGGVMAITLQEDHDSHGFSVLHSVHSDPTEHGIVNGETPDFSGPIELPFLEILQETESTYPSGEFTIQFWTGEFSKWDSSFSFNYFEEKLGEDGFTVPDEHQSEDIFDG